VTEFTQTIYAVANNAYLKLSFDRNIIKEYRLIGFDNKKNAIEDSTSELEGGEVGSGHSMMAIFEVQPYKKDSSFLGKPFADIELQYRLTASDSSQKQHFTAVYEPINIMEADSGYRFAAAIAMFGSALKKSKFINNYALEDVQSLAKTAINPTDAQQKEFLGLVEKAIRIYRPNKRKK
jgi:Ca-activated chloride channel family protein